MATVSYGTITITDTNDIEQIYMVYAGSSSDTQAPDKTNFSLWKTDITQVTGTYIWQRTVIKKSGINIDSSNFQNYYGEPVCVTGPEGTAARKITSVVPYYYLSTSSSSQTGGSWSTTPAAYPASGTYYYWTKTITTYDSGSPSESTPVLDRALNSANETARAANTTANDAKSKADTVEGNLNNYIASNDSALNALQTKTKYFWTNLVAHTMGSGGWTKPNYPVGTYAASGISGTTFDEENSSTYGYNTLYSNGIKLRYNAINLGELTGSSLIFYRPSTTTQGTKGMELGSSSLKFYDSTGSVAQATFGGTQATISGTINAYDGKIGKGAAAWTIGNDSSSGKAMIYTGTRGSADSAYLSTGIGTESIGGSGTLNTTNDGYWTITAGANFGVTTKGKVYASSGKIGGWNLESNRLSIGTWGSDNSAMLCSGSSGAKSIGGSPSNISDWVFTAGSNFGVTKSGDLYCENLNATGGSFTGALTATSLTIAPGATFDGDIDQFKGASFNWNLLLNTLKDAAESHTTYNMADFDFAESLIEGENYTISAKITTSSEKTAVGFFHSGAMFSMGTWLPITSTSLYKTTFTATSEMASQEGGKGHGFCRVYVSNNPNKSAQGSYALAGTAHVDWIKIEKGETASDWCTAESEIHGKDGISTVGLAMKVNYSGFATASDGECYFHGYNDQNEEADVDGWVMWNGEKLTITKGMWINPNGAPPTNTPILHVFRTSTSPYHADVWWDSNLLRWTGYMYKSASDKTPNTKVSWTWNEATDCILATYVATGNEAISGAQLFNPPKKFSEVSNPSDLFSMGVTLGSSGNMLLDTYARDLTKVNAKYNRYFSDASNTSTTASFVSAGNEILPDPNAKYFVRIKNTVVYNSSATDKGLKGLAFYNSGDYVNGIGMVVGDTYRASCWVRQLEGGSNFAIGLGGFVNSANYTDIAFVPTAEWRKYEKVFTFSDYKNTATTVWSRLYFINLAGFSINGAGTGIGQIDMCGFKLERINAIAASGRNLCLRSADYSGWGGSNRTTFSGNIITFPTVTANTWREAWQKSNLPYSVIRNQMITITYKVKGTAENLIGASVGLALTASETSDVRLKYVNKFCNITATGEWQTIAMSAYINDYVFDSGTGTPDYDNCYFNIRVGAIGNAECRNGFQMKEVMVALGSDPCAWSPAPEDAAAYTDESIDAIEIGGKNLLRASERLNQVWTAEQATIDTSTGIATLTRTGSGYCRIYQMPADGWWTWEAGVKYTASVEAKASENGVVLSFDCNSSGTITYDNNRRPSLTTEWKRYSCTFTIAGTVSTGSMTYSMATTTTGKIIYLRKPMLELGNKATQWAPAPEDLTQYFWADGTGAHVGTVKGNGNSGYNSLWSSTQGLLFRNGTTNLLKIFSNAITFFNSSSKKLLEITGSAINFYNTSTVKMMEITASAINFFNSSSTKMMEITSNVINFFNSSGQKLVELGTSALKFFYNGSEVASFGETIDLRKGNMLMRLTAQALKFMIGSTVNDEIVYDERVSFGSEVAMKSARTFIPTGMEDGYYSQNFMDIKPDGIQLKQIVDGSVEENVNGTFISNITGQGIKPNNTRFILGDGVYGESGTHLWYTGDNLENGILTNVDDDGEGMLFIAGWVTGSGKELMFTIPLCAPIAEGWDIDKGEYFENSNLSLTVTVRQNNHYLLGSGSAGVEIPRNATEWENIDLVPCPSGISVHYYSTTAFPSVTNNDTCGIKVGYSIPLIEEPDSY